MNTKLTLALALLIVGPSFSGCTDGGQVTPDDSVDYLVAQAEGCTKDPNSRTQGNPPGSGDRLFKKGFKKSLGYATGTDRTLLRWTPSSDTSGATFKVTRTDVDTGSTTTETVSPVTDTKKAVQILDQTDGRWPNLHETVTKVLDTATAGNVSTDAEMVSALHANPNVTQVLAQRYYPVAMVAGLAYLDESGQDGTIYKYKVERTDDTTRSLGTVTVTTGHVTPLHSPTDPACVSLESGSPMRASSSATWGQLQQQQQVFHRKVFLRWDPPNVTGQPPEWTNGYDVYRAKIPENPSKVLKTLLELNYKRVNDDPIQPRGPNATIPSASTNTSAEAMNFYHVDETPESGRWSYVISPRDILGNPRNPSDHRSQVSEPVVAPSFDFEPPDPPTQINTTAVRNNSAVLVNWTHPNATSTPQVSTASSRTSLPTPDLPLQSIPNPGNWVPDLPSPDFPSPGNPFGGPSSPDSTPPDSGGPDTGLPDGTPPDVPAEAGGQAGGRSTIVPESDLSHFAVYRSSNATARPPSPGCDDPTKCWIHIGNSTSLNFTDDEVPRGETRWYQVRAVDDSDAGNPSAWVGPAHATLHDLTPPRPPKIGVVNVSLDKGGEASAEDARLAADSTYGDSFSVSPHRDDKDVTRLRIYCRFSPGGDWTRVDTVPSGERVSGGAGAYMWTSTTVHTADLYDPPTAVEGECRARSVDESGNVGKASRSTNATFGGRGGSQELPKPIPVSAQYGKHKKAPSLDKAASEVQEDQTRLHTDQPEATGAVNKRAQTQVQTKIQGTGLQGIRLTWSMPDVANLAGLAVIRTTADGANRTTWSLEPHVRAAVDTRVHPGQTYEYRIQAIPHDPANDRVTSRPLTSSVAQGPAFSDIENPKRPLGSLSLSVSYDAGSRSAKLDFSGADTRGFRYFSIFRSLTGARDYVQITPPMLFPNPQVDPPTSRWDFTDTHVDRNYRYVVVEFDERTGEPIRASGPKAISGAGEGATPSWSSAGVTTGIEVDGDIDPSEKDGDEPNCQSTSPPNVGDDILFANGFLLHVDKILSSSGPARGLGTTQITTNQGSKTVRLEFQEVTVNSGNRVCHGAVVDSLHGHQVTSSGNLTAWIHEIRMGPKGTDATLDAELGLPRKLAYWDGTHNRSRLPLDNVRLKAGVKPTFEAAVHGNCQDPSFGIKLETAPVLVVPDGQITANQTGIELGGACTSYLPADRSLRNIGSRMAQQTTGPFPPTSPILGGANDGYLHPSLSSKGSVSVDTAGLKGRFRNATLGSDGAGWTASAPMTFDVRVEGAIEVAVDESRIAGGSLTSGEVRFSHLREDTGYDSSPVFTATFNQLSLDPDGRAVGSASLGETIAWNQLEMTPSSWTLLLGNVTYGGNPGRALVASHPTRSTQLTALGTARLEPGMNVRSSQETLKWKCSSGSTFTAAIDAYVRHGGVSHAFRVPISGTQDLDIHGYDGELSAWGRAYLDNELVAHETKASISLPDPTDVSFNLDPAALDDEGCIAGGTGFGEKTLDYWNATSKVEALEFRTPASGVPHEGDALLFAQGPFEVPHLDPGGSGRVPTEYALLPDGDVDRTKFLFSRPRHSVDGFPFLIEGFRLSDYEDRESPGWADKANIRDPPSHNPQKEGFLELQGRILTPYFGQVTSGSGEPPKLRFTTDDHYLGFDRRPRVEKTWVDVDKAELVWAYDVVYAQDPKAEKGRFTAFRSYQFVPLGVLFNTLEKPKRLVEEGLNATEEQVLRLHSVARKKVQIPFQKIQNQRKAVVEDVRSRVLNGLDSAKGTVDARVIKYFEWVRDRINQTANKAATVGSLKTNLTDGYQWFSKAITAIDEALKKVQSFQREQLGSILAILEQAQAVLQRLETTVVDSQRMARRVFEKVERAFTLLSAKLDTLPKPLVSALQSQQFSLSDIKSSIQTVLNQAKNLKKNFDRVLNDLQSSIDQLSKGLRKIEDVVRQVRTALGDALQMARKSLADLRGARDTLRNLLPDTQAAVTRTQQTLLAKTYDLQAMVLDPIDTIHQRIRSEIKTALDQVNQRFKTMIDQVERRVNRVLDRIKNQVQRGIDILQQKVVDSLDNLIGKLEKAAQPLRVLYMDVATVIRPSKVGSFLGLASGLAAIKATSETRGRTWSKMSSAEKDRWRSRIGWDEQKKPYGKVYRQTGSRYSSSQDHTDTVDVVDAWLKAGGSPPKKKDIGGGTSGLVKKWGVTINQTRGSIITAKVGQDDVQMEEFKLRVRTQIGDGKDPAFKARVVGMNISRHGQYYVYGRDIETSLVKKDLSADVDLLINTTGPRFEGGLTVYDVELGQVTIYEAGAAVGVGQEILYVGVKFDGKIGDIGVGGVVLAGRVDATSPVLKHHFPDALKQVKDVPAKGSGNVYEGLYLSAHADVPLKRITGVELGCVLALNLGARVGLWYFQHPSKTPPPLTFGIRVGGYAYGTVVCVIDARGEITVTFTFDGTIPAGAKPSGTLTVKGEVWVAAGVGDCDSATWKGWENRWWNDGGCLQAGAYATATGTGPIPFKANKMKVSASANADAEGPF